ncbi:MAG: protein-ADP-ribose hydrolase [bacterium]|nr:protein-ADP-ribose hydrolase [bacterium]
MNQAERRIYLIEKLLHENQRYHGTPIPAEESEQRRLLRGLMNVRSPLAISDDFLQVQDAYLQEELERRGVVSVEDLSPRADGLYLWQGDITRLKCSAIVNAANSSLTGCYIPGHNCIDNCIHTFAGLQLRLTCAEIIKEQGFEEPTGQAKITPGFNLPCEYILHTVGPIVRGRLTQQDCQLLASCYNSCLKLANKHKCESIAFCCISTGVFGFPQQEAAEIAVQTAREFLAGSVNFKEVIHAPHSPDNATEFSSNTSGTGHTTTDSAGPQALKKIIFNVFKDEDRRIYEKLL